RRDDRRRRDHRCRPGRRHHRLGPRGSGRGGTTAPREPRLDAHRVGEVRLSRRGALLAAAVPRGQAATRSPDGARARGKRRRLRRSAQGRTHVSAITGKHALVTGANRGIGAAIVRTLAAQGANVTLMVRDRAAAEAVASSVNTKTHIVTADVSDRAAVRAGCESAAATLGPVDILVNDAGTVETM